MLVCPSRTNEAAPWSVWELSSTKRGWGILTFPSAALDPALFPVLCLQKNVDTPFPSLPDITGFGITSQLLMGRKKSNDLVVLACFYCGARVWSVGRVPTLAFSCVSWRKQLAGGKSLLCVGSVCSLGTREGQRILVTISLGTGCTG